MAVSEKKESKTRSVCAEPHDLEAMPRSMTARRDQNIDARVGGFLCVGSCGFADPADTKAAASPLP